MSRHDKVVVAVHRHGGDPVIVVPRPVVALDPGLDGGLGVGEGWEEQAYCQGPGPGEFPQVCLHSEFDNRVGLSCRPQLHEHVGGAI